MTDHEPGVPPAGPAGGGGYQVPPQHRAPPDASRPPRAWGPGSEANRSRAAWGAAPPLVQPDEPAPSPWGPPPTAAMPSEPGRWGPAPFNRTGGTALIDRPTAVRPPVAGPAVVPAPVRQPEPAWEWERSHRLRNALLVAAVILLVGSLLAAFLIFRDRKDEPDTIPTSPVGLTPGEVVIQPVAPGGAGVTSTLPSIPPVTPAPPPVAPATTAVPIRPPPTTTAAPPPPAPATTVRVVPATTTTTRLKAIPPLPTTKPPTTTTTSRPASPR